MILIIINFLIVYPIYCDERPPGTLTDLNVCKVSHLGLEYRGYVGKSDSKVRCQSWTSSQPHKIGEDLLDTQFSDGSRKLAKNFCRNPNVDPMGPWCYTMNNDLLFETCGIPLCRFSQCKLTGPGMEYAGEHNKGTSERKCLKWDKDRKTVKDNTNYTTMRKFNKKLFPEENLSNAKKFCRNPNADIGGPWCLVENEDTGGIEKEYCDIPFCDDPICMVFSKNSNTYMHYTDFNDTLANLSFGVKLWDSDSYLKASARIVLSVLPLPLTGSELEDVGIGIEIFISNNFSSLRFGNIEKPDLQPTHGILKSTQFTKFSLSWHRGFLTFGEENKVKPIFLAEYRTKNNLLGLSMNKFYYYSVQGSNILWSFPFCKDDFECDAHITTGAEFQQFWPLREKASGYDLYTSVRAHHSACVKFVLSPTIDFPNVKLTLFGRNNYTRITLTESFGGPEQDLQQLQLGNILSYWEWKEFSIGFFANTMSVYIKKPLGLQLIAEVKHNVFRNIRWFSVSSENTIAHWSFFCTPPPGANPKQAFLPECAINSQESNYKGTQAITDKGLPCLPWSVTKLIEEENPFPNTTELLKAWNYCRNPKNTNENTYCYTISRSPNKKIQKSFCNIRKCKSEQCRMAGTGNDYSGTLNRTRSNRVCDGWKVTNIIDLTILDHNGSMLSENENFNLHVNKQMSPKMKPTKDVWNETLFPERSVDRAVNFCRNPSRNLSGSWCYTTDPDFPVDACNVRDCDKPEECTIVVSTVFNNRKTFILPQWKETGLQGGLRFAIKEWNPDLLDGIAISITPKSGPQSVVLLIAADYNEKVKLLKDDKLIEQKTLPHLIGAGKWTDFWLQIRKGEIMLGLEGVPTSLFEWISPNKDEEFEPMFISVASIFGKPIGLSFKCNECHTQNVSLYNTEVYYPIGLWREERSLFTNLTLLLRGIGTPTIKLMHLAEHPLFFLLIIDTKKGTISFNRVEKAAMYQLAVQKVEEIMTTNSWTKYELNFNETNINIKKNNSIIMTYQSRKPLVIYWFTVAPQTGWVTWSANCDPLDLDGPPKDGGWSAWSPWTCTVSCGGGEGYRTRTCSNPRPNIFGKLCQGSPTSTGKCNEFPCGDISPETMMKIRENLQKESFSYVVEEGKNQVLKNNKDILKIIAKESPKAYYEWTLNGIFIQPEPNRVVFKKENIEIKEILPRDSGLYVCMLFRVNKKRIVLRVISLAVISKTYDVVTRETRSLTLTCNAVILGYVYTDLSLMLYLNDEIYLDYGTTTLSAVNTYHFDNLNMSHTGNWQCIVEQKDLKLKWSTNYVRINVKKAPNVFTNLMEDKLTKPLFGWMKTEGQVLAGIIFIVFFVIFLVVIFLILYYKFCTLKNSRYNRNRR